MEDREDTLAIGGHTVVLTTTATAHGFRASMPVDGLPVSISGEILRRARDWAGEQLIFNATSGLQCSLEGTVPENIVIEASNWRLTPEEYTEMLSALGERTCETTTAAMAAGSESPPQTLAETVSL